MAKSVGTNNLYQSTFMPIFQKAETKIKTLILTAFLLGEPLPSLRLKIAGVIAWVSLKIPKDLKDRNSYLRGMKLKSEQFIMLYYKQPQKTYKVAKNELLKAVPSDKKPPVINNPEQLLEIVQKKPKDIWSAAKGSPNVINYEKELKRKLKELADTPITTYETGKKPISLWQKAELDVRYDAQMEKLEQLKKDGVEYAWTSTHPNCSKRCEKWQGKLMALTGHAKGGNFQVTTIDGHPVFSLTDIMDQTDKYGYHNNIICGFNCFDKETEVLTNHGWKLFSKLDKEDMVYTLNKDTKISEWQKPVNYFKKFYDGKMIRAKSFISDLLITPNHNMLFYQQHNTQLRFEEAKELKLSHIQYAGQEWVGKDKKFINIGGKEIDTKLFCRLLGYYLADGSLHDKYSGIGIAQTNNDEMWESLQNLPYPIWRDKNKIIIRDKALHNMFAELGNCQTKYVYDWVKNLSKEYLNEFLDAYIFTDGYKQKPKTINGYMRKPHKIVFTTNNQLCADLCEIALKCGYRPRVDTRKQKGKDHQFKNGIYKLNYDMYVIHLNYCTSFRYKSITEEDYNDFVYCVEVPNHTLLVKRNGYIQWCGNCRHRLIPYQKGIYPPPDYSKKEIEQQRKVESQIRAMERQIRKLKTQESLLRSANMTKSANELRKNIIQLESRYKEFCETNGYSWYSYRIEI